MTAPSRIRLLLLCCALALSVACSHKRKEPAEIAPQDLPLVSSFEVSDPHAKRQLGAGVYSIEGTNIWRWTAGKFNVTLAVPPGAAQKGATLVFRLTVPEPIISQVHTTTLSANVGSIALAPETYSKVGSYDYVREISASALQGASIRVDFAVNHPLPPSSADVREFGVIAKAFSLRNK